MSRPRSPSVDVVIPVYNGLPQLHRAIRSVERQTQPPSRVIIVDDASTEHGVEDLQGLKKDFSGLSLDIVRQPTNLGPGLARNRGWDMATADFIAFLDADEVWHHQKLELQTQALTDNPLLAGCGHATMVTSLDGEATPDVLVPCRLSLPPATSQLLRNHFTTPSMMLRRGLPHRFGSGRYAEDFQLWNELLFSGERLGLLKCVLGYRDDNRGLSTNLWQMQLGELRALRRLHSCGAIGLWTTKCAQALSLLKFAKRWLRNL